MDQTTETIRSEIDRRRAAMTHDVNEIEERARLMTDWEYQFRQHPVTMVALAFGGGMLLGALMGGSSDDEKQPNRAQRYPYIESEGNYGWDQMRFEREDGPESDGGPVSRAEESRQRAAARVEDIRGALMALAATKAEEFLREALPGFDTEVQKVRQRRQGSEQDSPGLSRPASQVG